MPWLRMRACALLSDERHLSVIAFAKRASTLNKAINRAERIFRRVAGVLACETPGWRARPRGLADETPATRRLSPGGAAECSLGRQPPGMRVKE